MTDTDVWENIRGIEDVAKEQLHERYLEIRRSSYDLYSITSERLSYIDSIEKNRILALSDLPLTTSTIDSWLDTYLPLDVDEENSGANTIISSNPVLEPYGTLFEKEFEETLEEDVLTKTTRSRKTLTLQKYTATKQWDQTELTPAQLRVQNIMRELEKGYNPNAPKRPVMKWIKHESATTIAGISEYPNSFTENEFTRKLRKTVSARRGLWGTVLDDYMADALEHYAKLLLDYPDYTVNQYINATIHKMDNQYRDSNRHKRKQVDMELMEESKFPEIYTVEEQIEIDTWIQSQSTAWKKLIKEFMGWMDESAEDAVVPKKFKQRFKRMKEQVSQPVAENHSQTYRQTEVSRMVGGLRDDVDIYNFPVSVSHQKPRTRLQVNHTPIAVLEKPEMTEDQLQDIIDMFDHHEPEPVEVTEDERRKYLKQCPSIPLEVWVKKYRKELPSW